jgi:ABC transporter substrate binding protein
MSSKPSKTVCGNLATSRVVEYRILPAGASLDTVAAELVKPGPDVIVAVGTTATMAAKRATATIPIVMAPVADPLRAGIVPNLAHPGGNITGTMLYSSELAGKRVDLFKQAVPEIARIAVLGAEESPVTQVLWPETQNAVQSLSLEARLFMVRDPADTLHDVRSHRAGQCQRPARPSRSHAQCREEEHHRARGEAPSASDL